MISRVTHYEGFQSYGQKPITTLKPGQRSLERHYYGDVVTKPSEGYLTTYDRWTSVYSSKVGEVVTPDDYKAKTRRPLDAAGKTIVQEDKKLLTSHWATMYQNEFIQKDNSGKSKRPEWSYHQKPHQVRMPAEFYRSKYA
ncbi:hypothetical protein SteCoe_34310 [Stentor coeruleus]|uniref:Uncharacterized protein n=1 Tax=Stentor coeruleus TaxID=5963 RepID=A0A1R2AV11_9CILI|nr:hypothetical protein SteCoe_34310 [Stentor coeruleus]